MAGFAGTWRGAGHAPNPAPASRSQILSNLVMEELMPTLQTDILPKMKGKKNDRKRAWFGVSDDSAWPALLLKMNIPFPSLFKVLFFFFFNT